MKQNSKEWYEWRNQGIGSSDAPVIMQVSPYKTPYQLWEEKMGYKQDLPKSLYILEKGHETEKKARAIYEITYGVKAPPTVFTHRTYLFARASLDGWVKEKNRVVEFKLQGVENHEATIQGKIPQQYIYQVMHQLMVTEAKFCDFVSYCPDHDQKFAVAQVERNESLINDLIIEEKKFWESVQVGKPPAFIAKDFKTIRIKGKTKEVRELAECYHELMRLKKEFKKKKELFLLGLPDLPRMTLDGHRLHKTSTDYKIEFKAISEASTGLPILGELWNSEVKKLSKIRGCNANRVKHARARWKENPDKDYWKEIIQKLEGSEFCTGKNNHNWKANFDFLIRPDAHLKIMEGKYDNVCKGDTTDIESILGVNK